MASKTILPRNVISLLHYFGLRGSPARGNRAKRFWFITKVDANHAPGDLCLVLVRKYFETWRKFHMGNEVRAEAEPVALRIFWPVGRSLPIYLHNQNRMMPGNIGTRIVCAVFVLTKRNDEIRLRRGAYTIGQNLQEHATDLRAGLKICIVIDVIRHLRKSQ